MGYAVKRAGEEAEENPLLEPLVGPLASNRAITRLDAAVTSLLRRRSISVMRIALGVVFLWFGMLKLLSISPVVAMVNQTYSSFSLGPLMLALGVWEVGIGYGLIFKRLVRLSLLMLLLHMFGTFLAVLSAPSLFFLHNNPLWLTTEGEFIVKNLVLVTAGLVIGGYELGPPPSVVKHFTPRQKNQSRPV